VSEILYIVIPMAAFTLGYAGGLCHGFKRANVLWVEALKEYPSLSFMDPLANFRKKNQREI